jgi:sulfite exporter TauE/SafE
MTDINLLLITAAGLGFTHTIFGPDHYVPFIVMSKARQWNLSRTLLTTVYCGIGHVASSVVIGFIGIAMGIAVSRIEGFESVRGGLAGWAFFLFGLAYMIWGIFKAVRNKPHGHTHSSEHVPVHEKNTANLTPWILFIIFVLGPCEILVPLLMYPAAQRSTSGMLSIVLLFSAVTVLTMCAAVTVGYYGLKMLPKSNLDRYMHAIAGATVCLSGFAILFLDL